VQLIFPAPAGTSQPDLAQLYAYPDRGTADPAGAGDPGGAGDPDSAGDPGGAGDP